MGLLNFEAFFGLFWEDPQLNFTQVPCFTDSSFSPKLTEKIWTPSIRFFDLVGKNEKNDLHNAQLYLLKNGTIHLLQKLALTAACQHNFDTGLMACTVDFGSDEHHTGQMNLSFNDFHQNFDSFFVRLPDLKLKEITYEKLKEDYMGVTFDTLRLHLDFEDSSGHRCKYYIFPMYVLAVLSWIGFFLEKNVTARVLLGLAILFAMCVLHYVFVVAPMPKISNAIFYDLFLFIFTFFVVMTLVELVVVFLLEKNQAIYDEAKNPSKIRRFFIKFTGEFVDYMAKIVFPICFIVVNVLLFVL